MHLTKLVLRVIAAAGLAIDAYVHFDLAPSFAGNTASISEATLFRIEASLAVVAAVLVILVRRWATDVLAFLVAAGGFAVLLIFRYINIGAFGPFPTLYEPIWYPKKTSAAVAEGVAMVVTIPLSALAVVAGPTKETHVTRTGVLALAAGLMALALAGCGDGGANAPASSAPPAPTGPTLATTGGSVEVAVKDFAFSPSTLTVPVGTTVLWRFQDSAQHNVTADDQSFKSPDLSNGQTFVTTFTKAGTFNYICTIHPFMKGTVTVR